MKSNRRIGKESPTTDLHCSSHASGPHQAPHFIYPPYPYAHARYHGAKLSQRYPKLPKNGNVQPTISKMIPYHLFRALRRHENLCKILRDCIAVHYPAMRQNDFKILQKVIRKMFFPRWLRNNNLGAIMAIVAGFLPRSPVWRRFLS